MIFILIGASGSGKTTLGNYLKRIGLNEVVSHTTRAKRVGEIEGIHYYFVDFKEFNSLEKIEEVRYADNLYCISKEEFDKKLKLKTDLYIVTDINGARKVKNIYGNEVKTIFIKSNIFRNVVRMIRRGDKVSKILNRIIVFIKTKEYKLGEKCDYTIENKNLNGAKVALLNIVQNS